MIVVRPALRLCASTARADTSPPLPALLVALGSPLNSTIDWNRARAHHRTDGTEAPAAMTKTKTAAKKSGSVSLGKLSPLQNLTLGLVAGIGCKMINYPLLVWKNASQQALPLPFTPGKIYRGLPMACMNLGGTTAVQFFCAGTFQKILRDRMPRKTQTADVAGALAGGLVSGIPCSVWELLMIQQQRFGGSLGQRLRSIFTEVGASGLGRGMSMTIGREGLFTMSMLGLTPLFKDILVRDFDMEPLAALSASALASSFVAATATHPLDTIKTCLQGDIGGKTYRSVTSTGSLLVQRDGVVQGLFRGLTWRIGLIGTTFFLVNALKERIAPVMFADTLNAPTLGN